VKTGRAKQTVSLVRKCRGPTVILKVEGRSSRARERAEKLYTHVDGP